MVVCKFWQQGSCRFGDSCRFEHPSRNESPRSSNNYNNNNNNNNNRFTALQPQQQYQSSSRPQGRDDRVAPKAPYSLTKESIVTDLAHERPQWILSAYGPGLKAPAQLFGGPLREQSFEEVRLQFYLAQAEGDVQTAAQQQDALYRDAEQQIQNALQNVDGAMQYILDAEKTHPNRLDICNGQDQQPNTAQVNPFGGTVLANNAPTANSFGASSPAQGAFGQASTMGQAANPFGAPTQPTTGVFGQPSNSMQQPNPFGTPQASSGAFGQVSALGSKPNPFGPVQAPTMGQTPVPTQTANPFGAPVQPSTGAFGQPSALNAPSNPFGLAKPTQPTPFGLPPQQSNASPFGQPSQLNNPNPFGQPQPAPPTGSPFANAAPAQSQASPFGVPQTPATNPFGVSQSQSVNPFGMASSPAAQNQNPFGAPPPATTANPFNTPSQAIVTNPFGAPSNATQPFASSQLNGPSVQQSTYTPSQPQRSGGITGDKSPYGPDSQLQHPLLNSYASSIQGDRLTMFKGKRVQAHDGAVGTVGRNGIWEKIWFPAGPPGYNKDTEMDRNSACYEDPRVKEAYEKASQTGVFEGGNMPLVPPLREWCVWDF